MRRVWLLALAALLGQAQDGTDSDLRKRIDDLQAAIDAHQWKQAAELSNLLKVAVLDARNRSMAASGAKLAEAILTWLPPDTETFVVAQQPFQILEPDLTASHGALNLARGYVLGLLGVAEGEKLEKALLGRTVHIAALAARGFAEHPPDAKGSIPLGMIAYQGCGIYAFAQPVSESILARNADDSVMGQRVWTSKGTQNDRPDTDTLFVSIPKQDTILVCNDRSFLTEMISRMSASSNVRALPVSLPEWSIVDRSAPLWAIRHLRADRAAQDPSQPAHLLSDDKDPEATGFVVYFGLVSTAARAVILAKYDPWREILGLSEFHGSARSQKIADGVWELSVGDKPEAAAMAAFVLMGLLGFAVNL